MAIVCHQTSHLPSGFGSGSGAKRMLVFVEIEHERLHNVGFVDEMAGGKGVL